MVQTEKSSVAQVYEQIVSDLKLAIGNLPVSNANGRAHYYAAKALLGKVYLQMAGEPLEDSEAAALAEVELNEVIQSGRFELVKDYFSRTNTVPNTYSMSSLPTTVQPPTEARSELSMVFRPPITSTGLRYGVPRSSMKRTIPPTCAATTSLASNMFTTTIRISSRRISVPNRSTTPTSSAMP